MKNHFITSYTGNKRDEVEEIYKYLDFEGVDTIVEPFCGSSALSYYISTKHPKKYKYILNDTNKELIKLYEIMKDEHKFNYFNLMNELFIYFWERTNDHKDFYYNSIGVGGVLSYFIKHRFYNFRIGLLPKIKDEPKKLNLTYMKAPIIDFLRNENVIISNVDAQILLNNNISSALYLLDPPYIMTSNSFYNSGDAVGNFDIYKYLMTVPKTNNIYLIVENMWMMEALFTNGTKINTYIKKYTGLRKKTSEHIIIKF